MILAGWTGAPPPERVTLEGHHARLEPLDAVRHRADLLRSAVEPGAGERFRYLFEEPPADDAEFAAWIEPAAASTDPLFFAVIDRATGRAEGRQALMRIVPEFGVVEFGHVLWGPAIARTRVATEAFYLHATYVFDTLGHRRLEWKCNDSNAPSKRAALRLGFSAEGLFRQHMVQKGRSRDTAWFAMTDADWTGGLRARLEDWLDPSNFGADGAQKTALSRDGRGG